MTFSQMNNWLFCQICGRVTPAGTADANDWIASPHRDLDGITVVRCPRHWSDWALRSCLMGRTAQNRERMASLRSRYDANEPVAMAEPAPIHDTYGD